MIMVLFVVGLIGVIDWFGLFGLGVVWAVLLVWCLSGLVVFVDLVLFDDGVCWLFIWLVWFGLLVWGCLVVLLGCWCLS